MLGALIIAAAAVDSIPDHSTALWVIAIVPTVILSLALLYFVYSTQKKWETPAGGIVRSISRERAEKSCDTVLSVCALLIPATLGLLTWLNDKVGPGSYIVPLVCALLYFFILLAFTIHLRFNYFWRLGTDFLVSSKDNTRFAYWLTTATSAIVLGLLLLSVPILELSTGLLKLKQPPKDSPVKVECSCKAPDPPPPPLQPPPCKEIKHRRHHRPPCACKLK